MTSTRLPGKVLADICGKPAIVNMINRVRMAKRLDAIVVATTVNTTDDPVAQICNDLDVEVFRGDEKDVLGRYLAAAEHFDADPVVRLTADCPMIDPCVIDQAIDMFATGNWDYVSNGIVRTYPDGLDVEVFSFPALKAAADSTDHSFCREHVTPYIKGNQAGIPHGDFKTGHLTFAGDFGHIRWTLDTAEDLERIRALIDRLPDGYTWLEALSVATREPELLGLPSD